MVTLISNSGLHFASNEIEFNPSEPLVLPSGRTLKYSFCEVTDLFTNEKTFDFLYYDQNQNVFIPVDELRQYKAVKLLSNDNDDLDETGLVQMKAGQLTTMFSLYDANNPSVITINSLQSMRVLDPKDKHNQIPAFELLLNKWLPVPMYEDGPDGISCGYPHGWCRVKLVDMGKGSSAQMRRVRCVWAFDTELTDDPLNLLRPAFFEGESEEKSFSLCNKVDQLLDFMSISDEFHPFSHYIASLLGQDLQTNNSYQFIGYYIYLINFLRLMGASPKVTMYHNCRSEIPVDLVLDIGNSRTCGVLFENGQFTESKMLGVLNLGEPWITYENKAFDMRVVFRKADFGGDIVINEPMFQWQSFVRLGDEAKSLVYSSIEESAKSQLLTNYSSPKRYLWDTKPMEGYWQNLTTVNDAFSVKLSNHIYVEKMSDLFDCNGRFLPNGVDPLTEDGDGLKHYSRASLMTFAMIEILQQALHQINSMAFRNSWGNIDVRRILRNVMITCPTAMPLEEQVRLRQSLKDAYTALQKTNKHLADINVLPDTEALQVTDPYADVAARTWSYDEAMCSQLVFLYAEIKERYNGEVEKFFAHRGHYRSDFKESGYQNKTLTIGSVDIGAGTTDIIICSYKHDKGATVTPVPDFWDSFYLAGDDILQSLVQNVVIEGKYTDNPKMGNISSALRSRLVAMSDDQLRALPFYNQSAMYKQMINEIIVCKDDVYKLQLKKELAADLIHSFFGQDAAIIEFKERRCRVEFNTQISVPIAQRFMELLRMHRPSMVYSFQDIFGDVQPASYLLDNFEQHFGFRFEELSWRFDPEELNKLIKSTMEPLMKQLSVVLEAYHCDIVVLAGRPTSLDAVTDLFIKYVPTSPDRLICLNDYHVGNWFPTANGQGYFFDQKSIVAVGSMVGYLASTTGLPGLRVDFTDLIKKVQSTARYMGAYNPIMQQVTDSVLTPNNSMVTLDITNFPYFIGCKQFRSPQYQARPLYALRTNSAHSVLNVTLSRDYYQSREVLKVEGVTDAQHNTLPNNTVELNLQTLANDKYWLDNGEFDLAIVR